MAALAAALSPDAPGASLSAGENRNLEFCRTLRAEPGRRRVHECAFSTSAWKRVGALDTKFCALRIFR